MNRPLCTAMIGMVLSLAFASFAQAAPLDKPASPPCTDNSPACLKRIAFLYIDALVTHDGAKIPLAPTVRRTENALTNAKGAYEVRESFARTTMVKDHRDLQLWADPATGAVLAFFVIDVDLKPADATATTQSGTTQYKVSIAVPTGSYTVHEAERFKIVKGYITQIEIIAHVETPKGLGSGWPVERDAAVKK